MHILGGKRTWYNFMNSAKIWGKSQFFVVQRFLNLNTSHFTEDQFCIFISSPIIWGNMKPKVGPLVHMVILWTGWYSNFICCFATLGLTESNFHKTLISNPIPKGKNSIHIFINQIIKEARNHHGMPSPLQASFSCTKDTQTSIMSQRHKKKFFFPCQIYI